MNAFWTSFSFAQPGFFVLLLLIPALLWWEWRRKKAQSGGSMRLTSLAAFKGVKPGWKIRFRPVLTVLRMLAIAALVTALARPQSSSVEETIDSEGVDIVLSIDISGSMLAEDLKPNRIDAAKKVAMDFVRQRPTDRIGLVIFSGESFTQCPVTIDHNVVMEQIENVRSGLLEDGTAIGMGLATAVDRLRTAKSKSRVVVLMTDGVNNSGLIDPNTALEIAKRYQVRVYTIGLGTTGTAPFPQQTPFGVQKVMVPVEIDEPLMKRIAQQTGGRYYRATSNSRLSEIYNEIDRLEKTRIEMSSHRNYAELFFPFALAAIIFLALEVILRLTAFRSISEL